MTVLVRASMALVALFAFALSFQSLMTLGELAGYGALAFMYPLTVDLGAVSSCAAWLATRSRQALGMTWVLLAISVLQNGTVHWLIATDRRPEWWLVTAVATVPPIVLGLTVHLAVGLGHADVTEPASSEPAQARSARPEWAADGVEHPGASDGLGDAADQDTDRAAELIAAGSGRRRLARALGVSEHQARQLLASRTNGAKR